jgi:hypothetical protein
MENTHAITGSNIINSGSSISASCHNFGSSCIEVDIEDFIYMPSEGLIDLAGTDVPNLAGSVD